MHPSFFDLFIEKKNTATNQTNTQLPTNTQPTSPTNIQHGGPPSAGSPNISLSSLSLPTLLILSSLSDSLFFPSWGPWMRPLLTPLKASKKKNGELQMCIFGSRTLENSKQFQQKKPTANFGPSLSNPHLSGAATFFCDTNVFFMTMFNGDVVIFYPKTFFGTLTYVFGIQCFFEIHTFFFGEYRFSRFVRRLVRDASGWEGNGDRGSRTLPHCWVEACPYFGHSSSEL